MIVHEHRLLADDSREISLPYFFGKLSSAAVVIGALRVNFTIVQEVECLNFDWWDYFIIVCTFVQ